MWTLKQSSPHNSFTKGAWKFKLFLIHPSLSRGFFHKLHTNKHTDGRTDEGHLLPAKKIHRLVALKEKNRRREATWGSLKPFHKQPKSSSLPLHPATQLFPKQPAKERLSLQYCTVFALPALQKRNHKSSQRSTAPEGAEEGNVFELLGGTVCTRTSWIDSRVIQGNTLIPIHNKTMISSQGRGWANTKSKRAAHAHDPQHVTNKHKAPISCPALCFCEATRPDV